VQHEGLFGGRRCRSRPPGGVRADAPGEADWRQVVRLVQRHQRDKTLKLGQHLCIHAHRLGIVQPSVHHPMADADQMVVGEFRTHVREEMVERAVMAELRSLVP